jgi:hypothetical protein
MVCVDPQSRPDHRHTSRGACLGHCIIVPPHCGRTHIHGNGDISGSLLLPWHIFLSILQNVGSSCASFVLDAYIQLASRDFPQLHLAISDEVRVVSVCVRVCASIKLSQWGQSCVYVYMPAYVNI